MILADLTNHASGLGIGGSGGVGAVGIGVYGGLGAQIVADPEHNVGLTGTGNFSFTGLGIGAQGGGQVSVSTAKNIDDLRGGAADLNGSFGPIGLDISNDLGMNSSMTPGPTTATLTAGDGVGAKIAGAATATGTALFTSTNCDEVDQ